MYGVNNIFLIMSELVGAAIFLFSFVYLFHHPFSCSFLIFFPQISHPSPKGDVRIQVASFLCS